MFCRHGSKGDHSIMCIPNDPALPHIDVARILHLPALNFVRVIAFRVLPEFGVTRLTLRYQSFDGAILASDGIELLSKKSKPAETNSIKRDMVNPYKKYIYTPLAARLKLINTVFTFSSAAY